MTLPALSNKRTPRKTSRKTSRAKATGAMVALALGAASLSFALPADASTAKLNGLCTKKELGKKTTKLICSKSGSLFRWRSRSTGTTSSTSNNLGGTSEAVAGLPGGSSGSGPATIGVAVLPFGNVPVGATAKVDLNCVGLPATPNTASQSLSFPAAGGSNQVTFTVSPPSSSNPTGSTCSAVATASVAAKLSVLVDGTPVAGPAANTVTTPAFTAVEGTKVTLLVDYTSAAPTVTAAPAVAPTLAPLPTVPLPTIAPVSTTSSAPTTTASPLPLVLPTSGRVEVATRVLTQVPITFAGVTAELLCSPGAFGQGYQSQTLRFDRPSAILNPSVQLGAVTPGFGGTACPVDPQRTDPNEHPDRHTHEVEQFRRHEAVQPHVGNLVPRPSNRGHVAGWTPSDRRHHHHDCRNHRWNGKHGHDNNYDNDGRWNRYYANPSDRNVDSCHHWQPSTDKPHGLYGDGFVHQRRCEWSDPGFS
jgi:hypothetical protein